MEALTRFSLFVMTSIIVINVIYQKDACHGIDLIWVCVSHMTYLLIKFPLNFTQHIYALWNLERLETSVSVWPARENY